MIETQSLAGTFHFIKIFQKVASLEEAFDKLYQWDRHSSNLSGTLREWRSLRVASFKTESTTWSDAMEKLYENATVMQDQLDEVHKHPSLHI